ncbi:MAG TPA: SgcJ/EcaC family oxidoreductase [Terriglobales bacterium]
MIPEEQPLYEIVEKLEAAWNRYDSVAWASLFAEDADFIHILGGHFQGRDAIEHGHRTIFDTIYEGSRNKLGVEKVRFVRPDVAIVFLRTNLKWYLGGEEQEGQSRPTLVAQKKANGEWEIVAFQNTLITPGGPTPDVVKKLTDAHPIKGDTELKK